MVSVEIEKRCISVTKEVFTRFGRQMFFSILFSLLTIKVSYINEMIVKLQLQPLFVQH